jgi:lysophospholipase L1-like esterase
MWVVILAAAAPAVGSTVTVMTIGDSLTAGFNGTSDFDTGYRGPLYYDLAAQGNAIQYIGTYDPTTYTGLSYDVAGYSTQMTAIGENHTNGFDGYNTNDLVSNLIGVQTPYAASNPGCLPNMGGYWMNGGNGTGRSGLYPDVALFMGGLNDAYDYVPIGDVNTPGTTLGNIAEMLEWFNVNRPLTHVVVAATPYDSGIGDNVKNVMNAEASVLPAYIAANFPQDRFVNFSTILPDNDFGDGSHPNDAGYAILAQAWEGTVATLVPNGTGYTHTGEAFSFASTVPSITGSMNNWQGSFDVSSDDMIVTGGNLATITNQIKSGYANGTWGGLGGLNAVGITSSAAADDTTHLTALGVMQNNNGNGSPLYSTFDGQASTTNDVLVKYTYYGDANLDGQVDGSDYSLIDNGFLSQGSAWQLTGWSNGDFNYDGVIDGSDYTLIDNSFNQQGSAIAAESTAQIAADSTAVPEPVVTVGTGILVAGLLSLRRHRRSRIFRRLAGTCPATGPADAGVCVPGVSSRV